MQNLLSLDFGLSVRESYLERETGLEPATLYLEGRWLWSLRGQFRTRL
jgi:hypothetical protein